MLGRRLGAVAALLRPALTQQALIDKAREIVYKRLCIVSFARAAETRSDGSRRSGEGAYLLSRAPCGPPTTHFPWRE